MWMKDGKAINDDNEPNCIGAASHTLCITSMRTNDEGSYYCVVSNEAGSVQSNSARLTGIYIFTLSK